MAYIDNSWPRQVSAQIQQEQHDAAMVRQRREMQRQIEVPKNQRAAGGMVKTGREDVQ